MLCSVKSIDKEIVMIHTIAGFQRNSRGMRWMTIIRRWWRHRSLAIACRCTTTLSTFVQVRLRHYTRQKIVIYLEVQFIAELRQRDVFLIGAGIKKLKVEVTPKRKATPKVRQFGEPSMSSSESDDNSDTSDSDDDDDVMADKRDTTQQSDNSPYSTRIRNGVVSKNNRNSVTVNRKEPNSNKTGTVSRISAAPIRTQHNKLVASVIWKNLSSKPPRAIQPSFQLTFNYDMESFMPFVTSQVLDDTLFISPWQRNMPGVRYPRHSAASIILGIFFSRG